MAAPKKKTARGRKQDRARVAGEQDYEVRYEAKSVPAGRPGRFTVGFIFRCPPMAHPKNGFFASSRQQILIGG
jgi:hypothetical protein